MKAELTIDNRNVDDMLSYYEARIEALAGRVQELEQENRELRDEVNSARRLTETDGTLENRSHGRPAFL